MATETQEALIIVNDAGLGRDLRDILEDLGWQTIVTNSVGPSRKLIQKNDLALLMTDEALLPQVAQGLSNEILDKAEPIPFIVITTQDGAQLQTASPLSPDALLSYPLIEPELQDALRRLHDKAESTSPILGRSPAIQQIKESIAQIAPTPVSVLITGESGSGKNLVAEAIHKQSTRVDNPFLIVNCGAIPETLLESELFGHEKGAFTDASSRRQGIFEAADKGTVFLDEIGEMSLSAQVRLLRVLDAREITRLGSTQAIPVDVRVIAATNRDLQQAVSQGTFRQDLFQRLRVIEIDMPALRSRSEDIPIIIQHYVEKQSNDLNVPPITFAPDALATLQHYQWPGNVRELINLIERLMVLSKTRHITAQELASYLDNFPNPEPSNLPVYLGKTPAESDRDLLYWAILEVARDVKELKAYLMQNMQTPPMPSLPAYREQPPLEGTEIEYTEANPTSDQEVRPLRDVEREAIINALRATDGHRKRAAKLLGMAERTLYRKIDQYGL